MSQLIIHPPDDPADEPAMHEAIVGVDIFLKGSYEELEAWMDTLPGKWSHESIIEILMTFLLGLKSAYAGMRPNLTSGKNKLTNRLH
jgi:hypothetical protein